LQFGEGIICGLSSHMFVPIARNREIARKNGCLKDFVRPSSLFLAR